MAMEMSVGEPDDPNPLGPPPRAAAFPGRKYIAMVSPATCQTWALFVCGDLVPPNRPGSPTHACRLTHADSRTHARTHAQMGRLLLCMTFFDDGVRILRHLTEQIGLLRMTPLPTILAPPLAVLHVSLRPSVSPGRLPATPHHHPRARSFA